jgi:hypothetical protein
MNNATLEFSVERYAIYPELPEPYPNDDLLPDDFSEWVNTKGDRFRDMFSRICFYLAERYISAISDTVDETVIVGTEYGNLEAMLRFQRQAKADHKALSAQQFPHATTSSASTFINIGRKIVGGNATLNAGALTPAVMLLHALMHLKGRAPAKCHIFLGDTYCPEAVDDIAKKTSGLHKISPGVCYLALKDGNRFTATISFDYETHDEALASLPENARVYLDSTSHERFGQSARSSICIASRSPLEHNRAFVFSDFLSGILSLNLGEHAALLLSNDDNVAVVLVSRNYE